MKKRIAIIRRAGRGIGHYRFKGPVGFYRIKFY